MSEETLADRIKAIRMAARDNLSEARHMPGFILPQIATIVDIRTLMRNYGYYLLKPTRSPP
jgi:hypothetical protein